VRNDSGILVTTISATRATRKRFEMFPTSEQVEMTRRGYTTDTRQIERRSRDGSERKRVRSSVSFETDKQERLILPLPLSLSLFLSFLFFAMDFSHRGGKNGNAPRRLREEERACKSADRRDGGAGLTPRTSASKFG